jgi:hypothetical protein
MNEIEIIEEFEDRSKSAKNYREIGALLLIISVVLFSLDAIYRTRIGIWEGVILAAGIIGLTIAAASAVLSLIKLRCPNCSRIVGEVYNATFCPACGAALRSGDSFGMIPPAARKMPGNGLQPVTAMPATGLTRRGRNLTWEPKTGSTDPGAYPDEAYPKNIRLFTTSDEIELTKRFIRLIDQDNGGAPRPADNRVPAGKAAKKDPQNRTPAATGKSKKPEGRSI